MFKEKYYNALTKEEKAELKRWLQTFDEIFLHIENGQKSFSTSVMLTTSYAEDEKDILFTNEDLNDLE